VAAEVARVVGSRALGTVLAVLVLASPVGAADASFPPREEGRHVFDRAEVLEPLAVTSLELSAERLLRDAGVDLVVLVRVRPETDTFQAARGQAEALVGAWSVGLTDATDALVILADLDESRCHGQFQFYADEELRLRFPDDQRQAIYEAEVAPLLAECDLTAAIGAAVGAAEAELLAGAPSYSDAPTYQALPSDFSVPPGFGVDEGPAGASFPPGGIAGIIGLATFGLVMILLVALAGAARAGGIGRSTTGTPFPRRSDDAFGGDDRPMGGHTAGSGGGPSNPPPRGGQGGAGGSF
jgi:uncharacterized membrane protein YgcG